jgi:hypothetical protein
MSGKNKGGREIRKPKQPKKPKTPESNGGLLKSGAETKKSG